MKKSLLALTTTLLLCGCSSQIPLKVLPCEGTLVKGCQPVVYYNYDSYEISPMGKERLDWVYQKMECYPRYHLEIKGFSDLQIQDEKHAKSLSYARAYAAKKYLIQKGISDTCISAEGLGSSQAICFQDKCQGVNRRIQIKMYKP